MNITTISNTLLATLTAGLVTGGCALPSAAGDVAGELEVRAAVAEAASSLQPAVAESSSASEPVVGSALSTRVFAESAPSPSDPTVREIVSSAAFRRRVAESLLAETETEPRLSDDDREVMLEVMESIGAEAYERAIAQLDKEGGPDSIATYDYMRGYVYRLAEQPERAISAFEVAVEKFPKYSRAWSSLGELYFAQEDFKRCVRPLTRTIELGGADGTTYGILGYCYANLENYVSAETAYRYATILDPDSMNWKEGLADSLHRQGRYREAAAYFDTLIAANPNAPELWIFQAKAYLGMEEYDRALENLQLVDSLGGSTAETLNLLGDIYVNEGLYRPSVDAYLKALELSPDAPADRALRAAKNLAQRGVVEEATALLDGIDAQRGEELDESQRTDMLRNRARLAVAAGASGDEARILEEIVALDPLDGEALILLGDHHRRQDDIEQAVFMYERAAALPDYEAKAKRNHAELLVNAKRYADAVPLLKDVMQLSPSSAVEDYLEAVERLARGR